MVLVNCKFLETHSAPRRSRLYPWLLRIHRVPFQQAPPAHTTTAVLQCSFTRPSRRSTTRSCHIVISHISDGVHFHPCSNSCPCHLGTKGKRKSVDRLRRTKDYTTHFYVFRTLLLLRLARVPDVSTEDIDSDRLWL